MSEGACQRPGCDNLIPSRKRRDARWCSRRCEGRATRAAKRLGIELAGYGTPRVTARGGSESRGAARARPSAAATGRRSAGFSDYGDVPGDSELAARIDAEDEGLFYDDQDDQDDDQAARFHQMVEEDADHRTPRETWKRWRAYSRRNPGVEHPDQTADRIARHRAAETAKAARIDQGTAGRIQDRFDSRTAASVAQNARESRRLNASHTDQPPLAGPRFDFQAEQIDGSFYRGGRPAGQRSRHSDFAWRMQDGWVY